MHAWSDGVKSEALRLISKQLGSPVFVPLLCSETLVYFVRFSQLNAPIHALFGIDMDLLELNLDDWLQGDIAGFTASDLSDEDGYITSFPARHTHTSLAQAKSFFNTYGFCVLSNVFDETECEQTRQAMWDVVESACPGLQRDDARSWGLYQSTGKYGLSSRGPCFNPTLVNNRQNEFLANALSVLLDTTAEDVMVSHDRFTIYRATGLDAGAGEYGPGVESGSTFATGRRNVHLDLNPWWWHAHARGK